MKVAVATARGNPGRAVMKQLIKDVGNKNIEAILRSPEKIINLGVVVRKGDYNSKADSDY